jgi:cell wall-associated NlpC family hydrolase
VPNLGDFGVARTNGWAAPWIRLITRSTVNHAFVYVGNGRIVEANPSGAAVGNVSEYPHAIWSHMALTTQQRHAIANAADTLVGTPYSWVDDVCIGLADLFGWHVPEPFRQMVIDRLGWKGRLMCSQLVDVAYSKAGVTLFPDGRIPGDVSPGDLLHLIEGQPAETASSTDAHVQA